jgi:hypothetical protein
LLPRQEVLRKLGVGFPVGRNRAAPRPAPTGLAVPGPNQRVKLMGERRRLYEFDGRWTRTWIPSSTVFVSTRRRFFSWVVSSKRRLRKVASTSIGAEALLAKRSGADGEPHAGADRHEHRLDGRFLVDEPGHVDDFVGV